MSNIRFYNTPRAASSRDSEPDIGQYGKELARAEVEFLEGWIPANPLILKDIRQKVRSKHFKTTKELLLEIRKDCSLFLHLIQTASIKNSKCSLDTLLATPLAKLESSVPGVTTQISKHDLSKVLEHQARNLQQMVISSVSVQMLALDKGINPDHAYLTVLLRMIGLNLAAWNYQHSYSRVLTKSKGEISNLDKELQTKLGFSPTVAALNLAKRWHLPADVYRAVFFSNSFRKDDVLVKIFDPVFPANNKENKNSQKTNDLIEVCRIAEGLACSILAKPSAESRKLWDWASSKAQEILGPDGLKAIEKSINSLWQNYTPLFSGWYDEIFSADGKIETTISDFGKRSFNQNSSIAQCRPEIRQAFAHIYKQMTDVDSAVKAFNMLICDLIPASGFMEGGIYIADQSTMEVSPLIMLGRASKGGYKPAYMYKRDMDLDPIVKSLMSGTIVKGRVALENREVLYISGVIGVPPDQLVVYLETSFEPFLKDELDATACFRAVQQCLVDSIMGKS